MTVAPGDPFGVIFPGREIAVPPDPDSILRGYPTQEVIDAIEAGQTDVTRRVEFYKQDGETVWLPDDEGIERLVDGSISIDYTRDERRAMDLTLDNSDNLLRPDPDSGLWYDKVVKAYRGVRYSAKYTPPSIVIVEESATDLAYELRDILWQLGYTNVKVRLNATVYGDVANYDIVASYRKTGVTTKSALLNAAFAHGKKVLTFGFGSTATEFPFILTTLASGSRAWGITPMTFDTPAAGGWVSESYGSATGLAITALAGPARAVATYLDGATTHYTAIITESDSGGRWFHWQPNQVGTQGKILLANVMIWMRDFKPYKEWEYQVGEFVIESISEANWPNLIQIAGRDYTAKCMKSKLEASASFAAGTKLKTLVSAIAANCGISKMRIPNVSDKLENRLDIERGTERWRIMKDTCDVLNYELFFDHMGTLVMRSFLDPTTSPIAWTFKTGKQGNLVTWNRSTNDSRLFNHIIVTGTRSAEKDAPPYHGQARNTEPSSPTRIGRIGDRAFFRESAMMHSNQQCRQLAWRLLKIHALETYEISWQSYMYPWLEAGEIIKFLDPQRDESEPTRYLMDTINLPMGLGPMDATGKRVTYVEDTEDPILFEEEAV